MLRIMSLSVFLLLFIFSLSYADGGNVEKGKELFETYGCTKCHPNGKGLEGVATKDKYKKKGEMEKVINMCIKGASKAHALDINSQEMKDIKSYIMSLGGVKGSAPKMEGSGHK
ncbi:MAG: hypothetical protein D6828_02905 [Nitrospirae bacterium]|nr:MAG: hypothetical protein D6828_02905 [Nitrospirota bacterium]